MANYTISNNNLSNNLKRTNIYFFILHLTFFICHMIFLIFSIRKGSNNICNNTVCNKNSVSNNDPSYSLLSDPSELNNSSDLVWHILIAQYTNLYINTKCILSNVLIGCKISIIIPCYNSITILLLLIIKTDILLKNSLFITVIYVILCFLEIVISLLYKVWKAYEMAFYTFKSVGASTESLMENNTKNSIIVVCEILFLLCSSDLIGSVYNLHVQDCKKSLFDLFYFACFGYLLVIVTLCLVRSNITNENLIILRISYTFLMLDVIFYVLDLILPVLNLTKRFYLPYNFLKIFIIFEKILLFVFLIYFTNFYDKLRNLVMSKKEFKRTIYL
jgi:hypothetical protein